MATVVGALAPIFLLILVGHALRRFELVPAAFWLPAERVTYVLFFPCLIVDELARANLAAFDVLPMAAALVAATLAAAALLVAGRRLWGLDGPAFTSVFQGGVRFNTYVGLAAARALYGAPGLTLTAVGIALLIPLVNVLSIIVLSGHGRDARGASAKAILGGLVRNPLIVAAVVGAALTLSGAGKPPLIGDVVEILARAALPLGLLSVGAGLDLGAIRSAGRGVLVSGAVKLLLLPALTAVACVAFGVEGLAFTVAVLFNALPCAPSAYILARQMGGDHTLMATVITVQTLLAALSLPLVLVVLG
ncbi:AEC family transporter [Azospirillum sp.]|uniref:AEC family transporter n=1 Tax=Azospirillum sp. TaxID=34012 RepID=UPI003D726A81